MQFILLVLLKLCVPIFCGSLISLVKDDSSQHRYDFPGNVLSSELLQTNNIIAILEVESTVAIEMVEDLPLLRTLVMENVNLVLLPEFRNLPKMWYVSLQMNNLIYIKSGIFNGPLEIVLLDFNKISAIEKNAFGKSVSNLYLSCNNLETFSEQWFQNINKLSTLDMSGNFLTKLNPDQFENFPNLKVFTLNFNAISEIGKGAFSNRNSSLLIDLGHNKLTVLNGNIFSSGKTKIKKLYIHGNRLTYLSEDFLENLEVTAEVKLNENPWQCKCWERIKAWLPDGLKFVRDPSKPVCVAPLSFIDNCVPIIDRELIEHYENNIKEYYETSLDRHGFCEEKKKGARDLRKKGVLYTIKEF